MLNQPSNVTPDEVYGTGTVDLTQDLNVTWRVVGSSAMTAYQIDFFQNNSTSTAVYSTGKQMLQTPFWGVNYAGETQYFTATVAAATLAANSMTNGNEYKFLITQWWGETEADSIMQTTASVFQGRSAPTLALTAIDSPVTSKAYTFTATYSQAQGDPLKWLRWRISEADNFDSPFVDTGNIYGTGELQVSYDGFLTGVTYAIELDIETANGIDATTGWVNFNVSYSLPETTGSVEACMLNGDACVWIKWPAVGAAEGYSIMRQTVGDNRLEKIADVPDTTGQLKDYSTRSGQSYIYYVFPSGALAYLTQPMISNTVNVQYGFWAIVEAQKLGKNAYSAVASHIFRYGAGGVQEGQFSNNNNPNVMATFTPYPLRQGSSANYMTGSVTGYIGTISNTKEYTDTLAQSDAVFALSKSRNTLFLIDPKGHFLMVHTAAAVTMNVDTKKKQLPQTMTVNWVEVGSTANVHLLMYPGGDYYPTDRIIFSTITVDPNTGKLIWTVPDNYDGSGTQLRLSGAYLVADQDGPFNAADLSLDGTTKILTATV